METVFCLCCSLLMRDPHELSEGQMAAELEVQYLPEEGRPIQMEVKARGQFLRAHICMYRPRT